MGRSEDNAHCTRISKQEAWHDPNLKRQFAKTNSLPSFHGTALMLQGAQLPAER